MSTETPEPAAPESPPDVPMELAEEQDLGGSPAGAAANAALRALSRAARSFLIYEPHNSAIRAFLEDYQQRVQQALTFGNLELDVRPFELVRHGEIVYMERDRGRSLAFRLFRDGIRKLTVQTDVSWEEMLKLLEILSVRYTGVRQQEDDIVTLLRKAGFQKIQIAAVEGFVPDEEEGGETEEQPMTSQAAEQGVRVDIPSDWDKPFPESLQPRPIKYVPIPPQILSHMWADPGVSLPALCLKLIRRMLAAAADPTDPADLDDVLPLVEEVRDFLLADAQLAWLGDLVDIVDELPQEHREGFVQSFASENSIKRILHSVPRGSEDASPELVALLLRLPGRHLQTLLYLLKTEKGETPRRVARKLVGRFSVREPDTLLAALSAADGNLALELLQVCREFLPDRAVEAALGVASNSHPQLTSEVLDILVGAPSAATVTEALRSIFSRTDGELRLATIAVLVRRGERAAFDPLLARAEARGLGETEAEALGVALAKLEPERARPIFEKWMKPGGLIGRWIELPSQRMLWWTAVAGLGVLPGEVEPLIRSIMDRVDADLRQHCVMTLVKRRKRAAGVHDG